MLACPQGPPPPSPQLWSALLSSCSWLTSNPAGTPGSLTLVLLGEYCSPSPGSRPFLPGSQDIRALLMREGQTVTKMFRVSDTLLPSPPRRQE